MDQTPIGNGKPSLRELGLHSLYSLLLFAGISFVSVYLPLVLREAGYRPKEIGMLLSSYNIVGLATILVFGRLLDTFRCYRSLILGGLLLTVFGFSRLFFLRELPWSFLAIIVLAVGFLPQVSLIDSYISNRYQRLPQYYGRIRSLGSLGYISFLSLSAVLQLFDPYDPQRLQVWIFGLFGIVALLFWSSSFDSIPQMRKLTDLGLREGPKAEGVGKFSKSSKLSLVAKGDQKTAIQTLGWPLIIVLLLFVVCWALVMGVNNNFLALFLHDKLGVRNISVFFIVATASEIPVIFWGGRILYRKPLGFMLLLAFSAALLRLLIYAALPFAPLILSAQLLHSVAYGLFHITCITIINRYFTKHRNTAIAIYASIPALSNSVGAMLGGFLIEDFGFASFFWFFLLLVLPIFIPIYLLRRRFMYL